MMLLYEETTEIIISCFYKVYNELGFGFLERVYENAMLLELDRSGLNCGKQVPIEVLYSGTVVGSYFADILVENKIILELKAGEGILVEENELQLINYLKATSIEVGLLLHFGKKPSFKRKVFTNNNK